MKKLIFITLIFVLFMFNIFSDNRNNYELKLNNALNKKNYYEFEQILKSIKNEKDLLYLGERIANNAIANQRIKALRIIFKYRAIKSKEKLNELLYYPTRYNGIEALKILFKNGADPNFNKNIVLSACQKHESVYCDLDTVAVYLNYGLNFFDKKNDIGTKLLDMLDETAFSVNKYEASRQDKIIKIENLKKQIIKKGAKYLGYKIRNAVLSNNLEELKEAIKTEKKYINKFFRGSPLLVFAIGNKNLAMIEMLLKNGADPNSYECGLEYSYPVLSIAIDSGNLRIIELLLKYGANPNKIHHDFGGYIYTDVITAVNNCNYKALDLLIKYGAKTKIIYTKQYSSNVEVSSPIHNLAQLFQFKNQNKCKEISQLLLKRSSVNDINTRINGETPLLIAVKNNSDYFVELILKKGAKPNLIDNKKLTALDYAIANNNKKIIKILKKYDAKTFKEFQLDIENIIKLGKIGQVRELFNNLKISNDCIEFLAKKATEYEQAEVLSLLFKLGYRTVFYKNNAYPQEYIERSIEYIAGKTGNLRVIDVLLKNNIDRRLLSYSVIANKQYDAFKHLVKIKGAFREDQFELYIQESGKPKYIYENPLKLAIRNKDMQAVKLMLDWGASLDTTTEEGTIITTAIINKDLELINILLDYYKKRKQGFHYLSKVFVTAAKVNLPEVVLLINQKHIGGSSEECDAYNIAVKMGHLNFLRLINKHDAGTMCFMKPLKLAYEKYQNDRSTANKEILTLLQDRVKEKHPELKYEGEISGIIRFNGFILLQTDLNKIWLYDSKNNELMNVINTNGYFNLFNYFRNIKSENKSPLFIINDDQSTYVVSKEAKLINKFETKRTLVGISPDGKYLSYVNNHKLYLAEIYSKNEPKVITENIYSENSIILGLDDSYYPYVVWQNNPQKIHIYNTLGKEIGNIQLEHKAEPIYSFLDNNYEIYFENNDKILVFGDVLIHNAYRFNNPIKK